MAKYNVTHTCGHTVTVSLFGKQTERYSRLEWLATMPCDACQRAATDEARAQRNAESAVKAEERNFPALTGSENQIAWANTIREEAYAACCDNSGFDTIAERMGCDLEVLVDTVFGVVTSASWWIDNRNAKGDTCKAICAAYGAAVNAAFAALKSTPVEAEEVEEAEVVASDETESIRIRPESAHTTIFVEIKVDDEGISAYYPKDDTFIALARQNYLSWRAGAWRMRSREHTGAAEDRAAELAANLLSAGFPVIVPSITVRAKVQSGDYLPVHPRWIVALSDDANALGLVWAEGDWYEHARKVRGARYVKGYKEPLGVRFVLAADAFEGAEGFAQAHDFRVTPTAAARLAAARERYESALLLRSAPDPVAATIKQELEHDVHPDLIDA